MIYIKKATLRNQNSNPNDLCTFWHFWISAALGKEQHEHNAKHLLLCSTEESHSGVWFKGYELDYHFRGRATLFWCDQSDKATVRWSSSHIGSHSNSHQTLAPRRLEVTWLLSRLICESPEPRGTCLCPFTHGTKPNLSLWSQLELRSVTSVMQNII